MAAISPSSLPSMFSSPWETIHVVALDRDAGVDRALGRDEAPDLFARLRLDGVDAAVAEPGDEQPEAVDRGDQRRRIGRVVRAAARVGDVDDVARPLVERDEAVRAHRRARPSWTPAR